MGVAQYSSSVADYYLLVVTENGFGKKTQLKKYKTQRRGGSGIKTAKITSKTGKIVAFRIINEKILY